MSAVTTDDGGGSSDAITPTTATTPSMMSVVTGSTAGTSPPLSPGKTPTAETGRGPGLIDAADVHKLKTDLKAAVAAQTAAETRVDVLEAELARFKDLYMFTNAAKEAVEAQLREEITRREKAEEKVEMLRGQVEQSREIVMRLQKQDQDRAARRQSVHAESADEPATAPAAKKRMSLYGGVGSRRPVSSVSAGGDDPSVSAEATKPPGGLRELRLGGGSSNHSRSKSGNLRAPPLPNTSDMPPSPSTPRKLPLSPRSPRFSPTGSGTGSRRGSDDETRDAPLKSPGIRGTSSSARADSSSPPVLSPPPSALPIPGSTSRRASSTSQQLSGPGTSPSLLLPATNEHIEALKSSRLETEALRAQVMALEMKLNEAEDARAASDTLVRSLREFMAADPTAGAGSVNLPPLPSEIDDDNDDPFSPASNTVDLSTPTSEKRGWGFGGLWRADSSAPAPPEKERTPSLLSRRDSASSTSASVAVNSPPIGGNEALHPVLETPEVQEKPKEQAAGGWLAGWRSTSTTQAPQAPQEVASPAQQPPAAPAVPAAGANLGRSLTSFFGRSGRRASAAKAARDTRDRESQSSMTEDDGDAPLAAAIAAAAAAETTEPGLQFDRFNKTQSPATTTSSLPLGESPVVAAVPLEVGTTIEVVHPTIEAPVEPAAAAPLAPIVTEPVPEPATMLSPKPVDTPTSATSTSSTAERIAAARAKAQAMAAQKDEERRKRSQDSARSRSPLPKDESAEAATQPDQAAKTAPDSVNAPPLPKTTPKPKTPLTVETSLPIVEAPAAGPDSALAYLSGGADGNGNSGGDAKSRSSEDRAARRRGLHGSSPASATSSAFGLEVSAAMSPKLSPGMSPKLPPRVSSPRVSPGMSPRTGRTRSPSPVPTSPVVRTTRSTRSSSRGSAGSVPSSPAVPAWSAEDRDADRDAADRERGDEREELADDAAYADDAGDLYDLTATGSEADTPADSVVASDAEVTDSATPPKRPERRARGRGRGRSVRDVRGGFV